MNTPLRFLPLLMLPALPSTVAAQSVRASGATLYVNEAPVLTLKATVAGAGPERRVKAVAERLGRLSVDSEFAIKGEGKSRTLVSGDTVVLDIAPAEAAAQRTTAVKLAVQWLGNLRAALNLPPLKLGVAEVTVPVGSKRSIPFSGSEALAAQYTVSPEGSVRVGREDGGLIIHGVSGADATLTLNSASGTASLRVRVVPFAAGFPQTVNLAVTGSPATSDSLAGALEGAVKQQLQAQPGRKIVVQAPKGIPAIPPGSTRTVTVDVKVTAPGALASEGKVTVNVTNEGLRHAKERELWYCNDPESLKGPSRLFRATLRASNPARMLYHHVNESPSPLFFTVDVNNPSDLPARVVVVPGDSPPDKNPVLAGVLAADPFFQAWNVGAGEIVTIPPRSRMPLSLRRLKPKETASGLCYLHLLPGGPESLSVYADAVDPFPLTGDWEAAEANPTPWREVGMPALTIAGNTERLSNLVFPNPFRTEDFIYRVGGPFGFIRIGQKPIARSDGGRPLDGNFGVVYQIAVTMTNPTAAPANVEVVFEASAGYSGGLFFVDGEYQRKPLLQPKAESPLIKVRLAPGENRTVNISTVPLSGSSYPATIIVRPVSTMAPIKVDGK
jgi:hypothetical protein